MDKFVEEERVIYGITTGLETYAKWQFKDKSETFQKNLIRSLHVE